MARTPKQPAQAAPQPLYLVAQGPAPLQQHSMDPLAVDVEDAAYMLSISRASLFRLMKDGKLVGKKLGRRRVFAIKELQALLA